MEQRQLEPWEIALKAFKLLRKMLQEEAYREGLTFNETSLLFYVKANGKANVTSLAKYLDVSKSSVVEMIEKLTKNGYLEKSKDENDRRVTIVRITKRGEEVLEEMRARYKGLINGILEAVGDQNCARKFYEAILKEFSRRNHSSSEPC
jgi:DNA-binding MarR family transcriptional regulator